MQIIFSPRTQKCPFLPHLFPLERTWSTCCISYRELSMTKHEARLAPGSCTVQYEQLFCSAWLIAWTFQKFPKVKTSLVYRDKVMYKKTLLILFKFYKSKKLFGCTARSLSYLLYHGHNWQRIQKTSIYISTWCALIYIWKLIAALRIALQNEDNYINMTSFYSTILKCIFTVKHLGQSLTVNHFNHSDAIYMVKLRLTMYMQSLWLNTLQ